MIDGGAPQVALKFTDDLVVTAEIFIRRYRSFEIARIGQAVGTDGAEFGQAKKAAVVFADVTASLLVEKFDAKFYASLNHRDFARRDFNDAHLGAQRKTTELRDDQEFAVGVEKIAIGHRLIGGVDVNAHAGMRIRIAIARDGRKSVDKIGG